MRIRSTDRLLGFPSGFPLGMVPPKNLDKRDNLFPHDSVLTIYNGLSAKRYETSPTRSRISKGPIKRRLSLPLMPKFLTPRAGDTFKKTWSPG
nr:hypothetical protein [Tanacetum cinerariifolium]